MSTVPDMGGAGDGVDVTVPPTYSESVESMLGISPGPGALDVSPNQDGKLWKEVLQPGDPEDEIGARNGMEVKVHYRGTLINGSVFDESYGRGAPFSFTLGEGAVIQGWDKGVIGMKRGEKIKLICHPDVAYKDKAQGNIPPNSTLIFEVEMIDYTPEDMTKKKNGQILRYQVKEGGSKFITPNHGSMVDILIRGKCNGVDVFPERTIKFRLGEGCENGVPYGVEKALYKFRSGEGSKLLVKGPKYCTDVDMKKFGLSPDSVVEFYVELLSHENSKEPWQLDGLEKLEISRQLKETGNRFFGAANYRVAFKNYKLIIDHLKAEAQLTGDNEEERKKLILAAYLNMAICNLKLNKPTLAVRNCDDALELDANNTKAFFRRGQAYLATNRPESAKGDFTKVMELDPTNVAVAHQLASCDVQLKANLKKEKQMYAKMFGEGKMS